MVKYNARDGKPVEKWVVLDDASAEIWWEAVDASGGSGGATQSFGRRLSSQMVGPPRRLSSLQSPIGWGRGEAKGEGSEKAAADSPPAE